MNSTPTTFASSVWRANAHSWRFLILIPSLFLLSGCSEMPPLQISDEIATLPPSNYVPTNSKSYRVKGKTYRPMQSAQGYKARGTASWYGAESGNRTASGVKFNPRGLTAAHKTLPIPSKVRVTNLRNGLSVDVVVNDRGPFVGNRLIDLSQGAAEQIGMGGLTEVTVEYLGS